MKRTGILGGTFNPIHFAHLRVAEEVREALTLDKVIFVPAHIPPHKKNSEISDTDHRLAMVELAIEDQEGFSLSDVEMRRPEKSYSLYTIRHFLKELGNENELYFIIGGDAFADITAWHRWMEVLPLCHFVVNTRPRHHLQHPRDALPAAYAERYREQGHGVFQMKEGPQLIFVPITDLDISSTAIRKIVKAGLSIRYLTPDPVIGYIEQHELYR